eukprot:6174458-Pleurochrysis_carterae.AAC.2
MSLPSARNASSRTASTLRCATRGTRSGRPSGRGRQVAGSSRTDAASPKDPSRECKSSQTHSRACASSRGDATSCVGFAGD